MGPLSTVGGTYPDGWGGGAGWPSTGGWAQGDGCAACADAEALLRIKK